MEPVVAVSLLPPYLTPASLPAVEAALGDDDPIVEYCTTLEVPVVRGSETDLLDRYHQAALDVGADPIVRITADCPAIDPVVVDAVVDGYRSG